MTRVLLLDCDKDTLEVTRQSSVRRGKRKIQAVMGKINTDDRKAKEAGSAIQECFIPPKKKEIAIFVDAKTQTKVTPDNNYEGGTVLLTKIYLDRLGAVNNLVRSFGGLSSIYVSNVNALNGGCRRELERHDGLGTVPK